MKTPETEEVAAVVKGIHTLLAGRPPEIQGAVLADLLATWLAGHIVPGDQAATDRIRADLLEHHLSAVHDLIPINEQEIRARLQ